MAHYRVSCRSGNRLAWTTRLAWIVLNRSTRRLGNEVAQESSSLLQIVRMGKNIHCFRSRLSDSWLRLMDSECPFDQIHYTLRRIGGRALPFKSQSTR